MTRNGFASQQIAGSFIQNCSESTASPVNRPFKKKEHSRSLVETCKTKNPVPLQYSFRGQALRLSKRQKVLNKCGERFVNTRPSKEEREQENGWSEVIP
jgi:hypothetical protein